MRKCAKSPDETLLLIKLWSSWLYDWLSTDGTSVSLWWKCLYTPLFTPYFIQFIHSAILHTQVTHFLPCVLIIICILCVFYDSIHVLNVYVLFRAITSPIFYLVYQSKSIKCCNQEEYLTWRLSLVSAACAQLSSLPYGESKTFLRHAVNPTVSIPRYGCPHPFSYINPCVNGVSLLLLFCLVLSTTLCGSFLQ